MLNNFLIVNVMRLLVVFANVFVVCQNGKMPIYFVSLDSTRLSVCVIKNAILFKNDLKTRPFDRNNQLDEAQNP